MLRFLPLTAVLSSILIPLLPEASFSLPSMDTSYPAVSGGNRDMPVCYVQTLDGKTLDLDRLCRNTALEKGKNSAPQINAGQCYVFDAAGHTCVASASNNQQNQTDLGQ